MRPSYFQAYGVLVIALGFLVFPVSFDQPPTLMHFLRAVVLVFAIEIVGVGLLFLRKWAALYFSIPLCWFGIQEAFVSISDITFPLNLLGLLHGISLTFPLVVTIRVWKQLTWGRRFF